MTDWVLSHTQLTPPHSTTDMDDQVGSRHSLSFTVYETSFNPTDLTSHVLNVALECVCVLSRISVMRDEFIGYKSSVLEDNRLPGPWGTGKAT